MLVEGSSRLVDCLIALTRHASCLLEPRDRSLER